MQSGRQKKKFSQQKKRHHEHIKAKGGSTGPASSSSKESGKKEKALSGNQPDLAAKTVGKDGVESQKSRGKNLGSNWDRYEEHDDAVSEVSRWADEELFEQRLIQLLNLPVHHVIPSLPSHTNSVPLTTTTGRGGGASKDDTTTSSSSFLNLDCAALAESLSALPMHQRLDLDPKFVQLCEFDAPSSSNTDSALLVSHPLAHVDLSACTTKRKKYTFEFKPETASSSSSSSVPKPKAAADVSDADSWLASEGEVAMKSGFERDTGPAISSSRTVQEKRSPEGDEELDKLLLHTANLTVQQQHQHGNKRDSSFAGNKKGDQGVAALPPTGVSQAQSPPQETKPKSAHTAAHQELNTDELDDMLDELLS